MSGTRLRIETAFGAMSLLAGSTFVEIMRTLGVTEEDYVLVTGATPWTVQDRSRVRQTLDAFSAGVMDVVGAPRFEMSAEYIAAVIVSFVHPTNIMPACRFMENQRPAESIRGASSSSESVDPALVFTLCCDLYESAGGRKLKAEFEKKIGIAINRAAGKEKNG